MSDRPYVPSEADRAAIAAAIANMPPVPPDALTELADALKILLVRVESDRVAAALRGVS